MSEFISPMLADKLPEGSTLTDYENDDRWIAEDKIDGHRLVIAVEEATDDTHVTAWSRLGNVRQLPDNIKAQVKLLPEGYYDGELYIPGKHSTDVTAGINSDQQRLVLFDVLSVLGVPIMGQTLAVRRDYLSVATERVDGVSVHLSEQYAPSVERYKRVVATGGEGIMLKAIESKYHPSTRSQSWLKVKRMVETELPVKGFQEGTTRGLLSVAELVLPNGTTTTVKARTNQDALAFTAAPANFIGQMMEVEAQEWTPDGKLRHPRMVRMAGPHE